MSNSQKMAVTGCLCALGLGLWCFIQLHFTLGLGIIALGSWLACCDSQGQRLRPDLFENPPAPSPAAQQRSLFDDAFDNAAREAPPVERMSPPASPGIGCPKALAEAMFDLRDYGARNLTMMPMPPDATWLLVDLSDSGLPPLATIPFSEWDAWTPEQRAEHLGALARLCG